MNESMPVAGRQRIRRKNAGGPRGRRALCWAVGLFALSQAALALWISHDEFRLRDPARHELLRTLRRRIAEAPSTPKVVVLLGSSHIRYGLHARRLSLQTADALGRPVVVANQARPRVGPVRSLLAMDRLLREGVVPDLVVFETFPLFLVDPAGDIDSEVMSNHSLDAGDVALLRRYAVDRPDLLTTRYQDATAPTYAQRANLTNFFLPWLLPPDRRKWTLREECEFDPGEWSSEQRAGVTAKMRDVYRPSLRALSLGDPRRVCGVGELVDRLRAEGTRVVFLVTPEGPAFRSWYPTGLWPETVVWLRELAAHHGVPLVDARQWTDREELFEDSHHLNKTGSEEFSRWLAREVLVPRLRAAD